MAPATQWYLEIQGKKTGPFTVEQIQGLLRDKEIPATARVTSDALGKWITVQEMIQLNAGPPKPFVPPPRPSAVIMSGSTGSPPPASATDPTASLFEALQAAKERKQAPARPNPANTETQAHLIPVIGPILEAVPARAWIVAIAAVLLGTVVWGIQHFARQATPITALPPPPVNTSVQTTATRPLSSVPPASTPSASTPGSPGRLLSAPPPATPSRFGRPPDPPPPAGSLSHQQPARPPLPTAPNGRTPPHSRFGSPPSFTNHGNDVPMPPPEPRDREDERAAGGMTPPEPPTAYPESDPQNAPPQIQPGVEPNVPPPPNPGPLE